MAYPDDITIDDDAVDSGTARSLKTIEWLAGQLLTPLEASQTALESLDDALEYETVAASQTDQMLGATGAVGDYLEKLLVIPASTSPGAVSIEDGSTNTVVFTGGASSVSNLVPVTIDLGIASVSGGWEITTGANVSVIAFGLFT